MFSLLKFDTIVSVKINSKESMLKIYFANDLFSEAHRMYNKFIAIKIRDSFQNVDLYLPQENLEINDKNAYADSQQIYEGDNEKLDNADILIAVIDAPEIDSGVSCEIGRFANICESDNSKKRYIIALYTDSRQQGTTNTKKIDALVKNPTENQFMYRNLYVIGAIKRNGLIVNSTDNLLKELKNLIN